MVDLLIPLIVSTGLLAVILLVLLVVWAFKPREHRMPKRSTRDDIRRIKQKISEPEFEE